MEKFLVTSSFSFSHNVFHSYIFTGQNGVLCGNGLINQKKHFSEFTVMGKKEEDIMYILTLFQTSPGFYVSAVQVFCKHCGKRKNCS